MAIILDNRTELSFDISIFNRITDFIFTQELNNKDAELGLILVSDDTIRKLNEKFFGNNDYTDILTFRSDQKITDYLGDIIIDINQVYKNKVYDDMQTDLMYVYIHGLLHLVGYDHINTKMGTLMQEKENEYFQKFKEFI